MSGITDEPWEINMTTRSYAVNSPEAHEALTLLLISVSHEPDHIRNLADDALHAEGEERTRLYWKIMSMLDN
jgi:hypothetical protein